MVIIERKVCHYVKSTWTLLTVEVVYYSRFT